MMWRQSILILLVFSSACLAAGDEKISKETFRSNGKSRTYYLFVPHQPAGKTPMPLLLTLHGSGRNGKSLVEKWKAFALQEGILVAGLDATNSEAWVMPADGPGVLHDLVEILKAKYPINERRLYLFGHSAGGNFALLMAMLESEYFAAAAIHAGAIHKSNFSFIDYAKRKIPLSIFIGDRDAYFPLQMIQDTKEALERRALQPEVNILKNHDHNYYNIAPKLNKSVWDFLQAQVLPATPKYQSYDIR